MYVWICPYCVASRHVHPFFPTDDLDNVYNTYNDIDDDHFCILSGIDRRKPILNTKQVPDHGISIIGDDKHCDPDNNSKPESTQAKKQKSQLKVVIANFRCIWRRAVDLTAFYADVPPDILLGCETWLDNEICTAEIFPSGYQVYRKERNSRGGGVFIATKDTISQISAMTYHRAMKS